MPRTEDVRLAGYPANAVPAGAASGGQSYSRVTAPAGRLVPGGEWSPSCPRPTKKGEPCQGKPTSNGLCMGHSKSE